jgi:serine/threonine protein kinase
MRFLVLLCLLTLEPVTAEEPARLLFSRLGPTRIGLFLADANNSNERALRPADSLDYNPSFSADGKWIVFTSEEEAALIDFSIAIVKDANEMLYGLSRAAGSFDYMAPEQGIGYAGSSGDIYSLAKLVVEMLAGRRLSHLLPAASGAEFFELYAKLTFQSYRNKRNGGVQKATVDNLDSSSDDENHTTCSATAYDGANATRNRLFSRQCIGASVTAKT